MVKQKQITEDKRKLRADARRRRDALSYEDIRGWSNEICRVLGEQPTFQDARTVCFYYPLGSEASLLPLAKAALALGKQAAFPRVAGNDMDFYRVLSLEGFSAGAFHVMEPVGDTVVREQGMLVFVPGLAFDGQGGRMGYGKGYYDKYFARTPCCRKIGVCYEMQIVSQVPCGDFDVRMDAVATERGIINLGGKTGDY